MYHLGRNGWEEQAELINNKGRQSLRLMSFLLCVNNLLPHLGWNGREEQVELINRKGALAGIPAASREKPV